VGVRQRVRGHQRRPAAGVLQEPAHALFIASGYYDLATPYFATEYTLSHLGLPPEARERVSTREYEAGHMMYIHLPSLTLLSSDVQTFLKGIDSL
jgi:carboxypeptidase C (cathepsin A)